MEEGSRHPKVKVSQHVILDPQSNGKQLQTCKYCGHNKNSVVFQTTKWAVHLLTCSAAPNALKESILQGTKSKEIHDAARMMVEGTDDPVEHAGPQGKSSAVLGSSGSADGGGGPPSSLTEYVRVTPIDGDTRKTQMCRYCGKSKVSSMFQATKWAVHLLVQCQSVPFSVKTAVLQGSRSREVFECALQVDGLKEMASSMLALKSTRKSSSSNERIVAPSTGLSATAAPWTEDQGDVSPPPKRLKSSLPTSSSMFSPTTTFLRGNYCDQVQADRISLAIAKFFASCALPMVVVESPPFLSLLRSLNSTYVDKFLVKSDEFTNVWLPALYKSVEEQVKKVWSREKDMKRTLGLETFLESDAKVCFFAEAFGRHATFQECVIESNSESATNASILLKQLETVAHERNVAVEDHFCAVTLADANMNSIDDEFAKFPKVFVNGCRSHCLETIYKDISNVDEVSQVLRDAKLMTDVTSNHPAVLSAFLRLSGGKALVRAGPHNLKEVLQNLISSAEHLKVLVNEEGWDTNAFYVANSADFVKLVSDVNTFEKFRCLNKLFASLCLVVKHVERPDFRSSWIVPLFEALMGDVKDWAIHEETGTYFSRGTRELVQLTVEDWWRNYNSDHYLVATLCDPAVFPGKETLPSDWLSICGRVLQKFFTGRQQIDARQEIMKIVAGTGVYGEEVEQRRGCLVHLEAPESHSKVELVVKQQETFASETPHLLWETVLYREYPLLTEIASRLLVMSTRSNVVERACRVRNLSKSCDRFCNKKVYMLLYCHINLRLSNDDENNDVMEGFLEQAILDQASEQGKNTDKST